MRGFRRSCKLDYSDRRRLDHALDHCEDARTYRRLQAVCLLAKGHSIREVAALSRCPRRSLYRWLGRYRRTGRPEALQDASRSGRPRQAPILTRGRIVAELKHKPWLLGYSTTVWTVALLARQLSQRYDCQITPWTLRRRLRQCRLRWKRPRHIFCRQEPHVAQKKGSHYQAFAALASSGCAPGGR
jgi:transposase